MIGGPFSFKKNQQNGGDAQQYDQFMLRLDGCEPLGIPCGMLLPESEAVDKRTAVEPVGQHDVIAEQVRHALGKFPVGTGYRERQREQGVACNNVILYQHGRDDQQKRQCGEDKIGLPAAMAKEMICQQEQNKEARKFEPER